jgi:alpha-ketoglutarate-dependent taurine dioxygenase
MEATLGPRSWIGETLPEAAGRHALPADALAELEAAVEALRRDPLPAIALTTADFALDRARAFMASVRDELQHGYGFAVIERLPVERWLREEATAAYWLLSACLARPVAQSWDGKLIYDVHDSGKPVGNGVRPDVTNVEQNFHTDNSYNHCPPHIVGLLCLQTARRGGVSGIVSFAAAHAAMRERHPSLLARLHQPFYFDRQREHPPGDVMTSHHSMFEWQDGRLVARLSHRQVVNGHRLAGVPLDGEAHAALETFEAILNEPGRAQDFVFAPGQIQYLNNLAIGHRRTAFEDWPEPERKRRLVRLWLRDTGQRGYGG